VQSTAIRSPGRAESTDPIDLLPTSLVIDAGFLCDGNPKISEARKNLSMHGFGGCVNRSRKVGSSLPRILHERHV
jgi:hypothetical protein